MKLFLMRHGDALPVGGAVSDDAVRPLSPQGRSQVRQAAQTLKQKAGPLDTILTSPLLRAKETAEIMAEVMGLVAHESLALSPSGSLFALQKLILTYPASRGFLWVGHHPDVTLWTAFLTGLDASVCPVFHTASIAALQIDPSTRKGEFLWFQP